MCLGCGDLYDFGRLSSFSLFLLLALFDRDLPLDLERPRDFFLLLERPFRDLPLDLADLPRFLLPFSFFSCMWKILLSGDMKRREDPDFSLIVPVDDM